MTKVKICGLSRMEDIETVNRFLPDFIGFVFAESRRRVDIRAAAELKERLDPSIGAVGVFVNGDLLSVSEIYKEGIIGTVQLHGDEDDEYIKRLKDICACPVIKAAGVAVALPALPKECDYILFDTFSSERGGSGKPFDWTVLKGYSGIPYFLAGGLSAENASAAIKTLYPFCADVSSGVETNGLKDPEKIEKFISRVRELDVTV